MFHQSITSPVPPLIVAYLYVGILSIILYILGFYTSNQFFNWGPPVNFFGQTVESNSSFNLLLFTFFVHQLINNWISQSVYPYIINEIQDPKTVNLRYTKKVSLILINLYSLYSELDLIFIINGAVSQISFFVSIIMANIIVTTLVNSKYIDNKNVEFDEIV